MIFILSLMLREVLDLLKQLRPELESMEAQFEKLVSAQICSECIYFSKWE